jgi:hypothetical protein
VDYTIRYRRPETPYALSRIVVPDGTNPREHIRRLETLGYAIVEISPPLDAVRS